MALDSNLTETFVKRAGHEKNAFSSAPGIGSDMLAMPDQNMEDALKLSKSISTAFETAGVFNKTIGMLTPFEMKVNFDESGQPSTEVGTQIDPVALAMKIINPALGAAYSGAKAIQKLAGVTDEKPAESQKPQQNQQNQPAEKDPKSGQPVQKETSQSKYTPEQHALAAQIRFGPEGGGFASDAEAEAYLDSIAPKLGIAPTKEETKEETKKSQPQTEINEERLTFQEMPAFQLLDQFGAFGGQPLTSTESRTGIANGPFQLLKTIMERLDFSNRGPNLLKRNETDTDKEGEK